MYLAEVNEDVLRKRLIEVGYDKGYSQGEQNLLTEQITKKIKAGKSLEQIADEVEETVEAIQVLYERILAEQNNQ